MPSESVVTGPLPGERSSSKSSSSSAAGSCDATLGEERLERRDGVLVELVLEHERVELGGLDLAALLRLGGERVQCGNLDDAGLQVSSFRFRARGAVSPRACGVCQ